MLSYLFNQNAEFREHLDHSFPYEVQIPVLNPVLQTALYVRLSFIHFWPQIFKALISQDLSKNVTKISHGFSVLNFVSPAPKPGCKKATKMQIFSNLSPCT